MTRKVIFWFIPAAVPKQRLDMEYDYADASTALGTIEGAINGLPGGPPAELMQALVKLRVAINPSIRTSTIADYGRRLIRFLQDSGLDIPNVGWFDGPEDIAPRP